MQTVGRGVLTPKIKTKMDEFFKWPTGRAELHLLPYIQFELVNNQNIDPKKINGEEREIIARMAREGHLIIGPNLSCSPEFWAFMHEIIWLAYVVYREEAVKVLGLDKRDDEPSIAEQSIDRW